MNKFITKRQQEILRWVQEYEKVNQRYFSTWIGREIEYRCRVPLRVNSRCYRGRIREIVGYNRVLVEVTYITSFPTTTQRVTQTVKDIDYFRKAHHRYRLVYRKSGQKYPWQPMVEKKYHLVKWSGGRWKQESDLESLLAENKQ